jgi:hypothetical protein
MVPVKPVDWMSTLSNFSMGSNTSTNAPVKPGCRMEMVLKLVSNERSGNDCGRKPFEINVRDSRDFTCVIQLGKLGRRGLLDRVLQKNG